MPVYHSRLSDKENKDKLKDIQLVCKAAVCPLKENSVKGPAPTQREKDELDIVDEAITYFRANILFNTFDVEGPADLTLIYLTAWIADCLRALANQKTKADAKKVSNTIGINKKFQVPGDPKFPFGVYFDKPKNNNEKQLFVDYFQQLRYETLNRLIEICYDDKGQNKFWFQFSKRRFMNVWNS